MVEFERRLEWVNGVATWVTKPKTTFVYKRGVPERVTEYDTEVRRDSVKGAFRTKVEPQPIRFGEGASIDDAIEYVRRTDDPEEAALLPGLLKMKRGR